MHCPMYNTLHSHAHSYYTTTYFLYIVIFTGFLYSCICYGEKGFPSSSYIFAFAIVSRINTVDMALRDATRICSYEQYNAH